MVSEILAIVIERNKLVDSLKKMMVLYQEQIMPKEDENDNDYVGAGELGEFEIEEDLIKDLGSTIVSHT